MTAIRILHVDDEQDIREVTEISLGLDPDFAVKSCGSGMEAIAVAAEWQPDLILLDVMMPVMDGPATFAQLRQNAETAGIPVIFMTARAQAREVDRFRSLGAIGVIAKPFDPMTLAALVRRYAPAAESRISALRNTFLLRVREDAKALARLRAAIGDCDASATLRQIEEIAHGLSGTASIYGFHRMSADAGAVEDAAADVSGAAVADVQRALDQLLAAIESESIRTADA
jgi:CheY-like chemotaxis protein